MDTAGVAGLLEGLLAMHQELDERHSQLFDSPLRGSPAFREAAAWTRGGHFVEIHAQAALFVSAAADHALAMVLHTAHSSAQTMPVAPLARASLEASAFAFWLLDPHLPARERVARSLSLRFHDVRQGQQLGRAVVRMHEQRGGDTTELQRDLTASADRLRELEKDAQAALIRVRFDKDQQPTGVDPPPPSATEAIAQLLEVGSVPDLANYRILSALAHCQTSMVAQLAYSQLGSDPTGRRKALNHKFVAWCAMKVAHGLARATWRALGYHGLDRKPLEQSLGVHFDRMGLHKRLRFWL